MTSGAGTGPGLKGDGSQNAADGTSTGDAAPGSGSATSTAGASTGDKKNAGSVDRAPFVITGAGVCLDAGWDVAVVRG